MSDPETGAAYGAASHIQINSEFFESKQVRHNFIKKVYGLLTTQLIITVAVVALFALNDNVRGWAKQNQWFNLAAFAVVFTLLIVLACFKDVRRKHPHNIIILFAFTIAQSLVLSAMTMHFQTQVLLTAGGLTLAITVALTLFAMQTRWDFTAFSGIMVVVLMTCTLTMIIGLMFRPNDLFMLIMASIMAILMGIFIVIDTQMIMGGTREIQLSPEEFIFATINLYMDIINMFMYILIILGKNN